MVEHQRACVHVVLDRHERSPSRPLYGNSPGAEVMSTLAAPARSAPALAGIATTRDSAPPLLQTTAAPRRHALATIVAWASVDQWISRGITVSTRMHH